jgi:hypothetical protein
MMILAWLGHRGLIDFMNANQQSQSIFNKRWISLVVIIAAGILFAFLKLNRAHIDQTLWAEDGVIFINQARELGVTSLWITYNGYFHLYPRLVAWLSSVLDLQTTPLIFFSAWFLAYLTLIYVTASRVLYYGFNPVESGLLIILMLAQPHSGEVFFSLTNAQWFIGGALAIYLLLPVKDNSSIYEKMALLLAALTGPFALVLTPILMMQLVIYRDWNDRKYIYLIIGSGALVQIAAIFLSNRLTDGGYDKDISHWMIAVLSFVMFGCTSISAIAASILFWVTTAFACAVKSSYKTLERRYDSIGVVLLSCLVGVVLFYGVSLLASKNNPHFLNPLGGGARYFFIPYLLVFLAVCLVALKQPKLKFLIYGSLVILAVSSFHTLNRSDLQFKAFSEFAKVKTDILIPIHPQWEAFPSWHIHLPVDSNHLNKKVVDAILLTPEEAKTRNIIYSKDGLISFNENPQLFFDIGEKCKHSRYLGMEIHINRRESGWLHLFWSEDEIFSEHQSLRRYYPAGDAVVQFALPKYQYLRFDPLEKPSQFYMNEVRLYCLGD